MFRQLSLDEFLKLSQTKSRVAVYQEFPCDDLTPSNCLQILRITPRSGVQTAPAEGISLLESAIKDKEVGRYSLLAIDPIARFSELSIDALRSHLKKMRCAHDPKLPPLIGGAIGFLSYDAVRLFEEIPDRHKGTSHFPDLFFLFHEVHIAFDHFKGTILFSVAVDVSADPKEDYKRALNKILELREILSSAKPKIKHLASPPAFILEEMGDDVFCEKVKEAKEYIKKGDIFQVVLSRAFTQTFDGSPFDVYRALRLASPAPFMFYLETEKFCIAGASPERLIRVEKGIAQTMPIAGTCRRIAGKEEEMAQELLSDPKEDAEHMMLVDLGRNDLGAIAEVGSVCVKELKAVRHFSHVSHLVSIIEAKVKEGFDSLDVLRFAFPAGTLSGAPKIRAMEIIDELELSRRGIYGGAICTIDNQGEMDSCIAIRMALFQEGKVTVRAGAGIVLDSDPEKEAQETRDKAKGVLEAIRMVQEGML